MDVEINPNDEEMAEETSPSEPEMTAEACPCEPGEKQIEIKHKGGGSSNPVYGLGMIGAWIFYIGRAKSFQEGVLGFLKGLVWPALLVYELLKFLNKE